MSDEDIRENGEATEDAEEVETAEGAEAAACEPEGEEVEEVADGSDADADGSDAEADGSDAGTSAGAPSCGEELGDDYELVELELSEDDIVRYLEDDEGNQIGFVVLEDGEECEYLYVEEDEDEPEQDLDPEAVAARDGSLGITRDGVQAATDDMNAIFKDGVKVAAEMKGAFDDIKSALDFSSFLK